MDNKEVVVKIKDLNFQINERKILKNINLEVSKGEFVGLIGPNGAGKTTLLKCLNKINSSTGVIEVYNKNINELSEKEVAKKISLMHQNTTVSFPYKCLDVVLMGRYPYFKRFQGQKREDYKKAREYMEYTNTLSLEEKFINQISGGERQRVLFAKVLAQETEIMLLDEPTASLDISHQEQIFRYSKELTEEGKVIIAAVHDLKIAAKYCSKLVLMKNGEILCKGSPTEVLTKENISKAYDIDTVVYKNPITGVLDYYIVDDEFNHKEGKIHVIGGGGSASAIIKYLHDCGYNVTLGVVSKDDTDYKCSKLYNIEVIESRPFSKIEDKILDDNKKKVEESDITILCNLDFGVLNIQNLECAKFAKKLIIIEDTPIENRDYTNGEAIKIYNELKLKEDVVILKGSEVLKVL